LILAHSRPSEGLILSVLTIASGIFLVARMGCGEFLNILRRCGLPLFVGATLTVLLTGLLRGVGISPHYAAPGAALFVFVIIEGLRRLRTWRHATGTGLAFTCWLCLLCVLTVPIVWNRALTKNSVGWFRDRKRVQAELQVLPGKHLVLMRYAPNHNPNREWVFNGADLDHEKILWVGGWMRRKISNC